MIKTVLLIGFGTLGSLHAEKIAELKQLQLSSIVDTNTEARLKAREKGYQAFSSLEEAFAQQPAFDVIVVATNTASHYKDIRRALELNKKPAALFVEKPLVANAEEARDIGSYLRQKGLSYTSPFMCGYLLRGSEVVTQTLVLMQKNSSAISNINIVYKKLRNNNRPSAGVIQDEATHSLDLSQLFISKTLATTAHPITVQVTEAKRSRHVIDPITQDKLYTLDDPRRVPFSTIRFSISYQDNVSVTGYSSFEDAPQVRHLMISTREGSKFNLSFDHNNQDSLEYCPAHSKSCISYNYKNDKLKSLWVNFANYIETGQKPLIATSLDEAIADVMLTDELTSKAEIFLDRSKTVIFSKPSATHPQKACEQTSLNYMKP